MVFQIPGRQAGRQAGWIRLSLTKERGPWLPMPGGTQPNAASLTSLLQDEGVEVMESFCSLEAGPLVIAGAAEHEVPHQPPQHHKLMPLGALVSQDLVLCKAGADLGEERQQEHKGSPRHKGSPSWFQSSQEQPTPGQGCWKQVPALPYPGGEHRRDRARVKTPAPDLLPTGCSASLRGSVVQGHRDRALGMPRPGAWYLWQGVGGDEVG